MGYREPGVYTELINARPNSGFLPSLVPVIIGEGPKYFDHEGIPIIRDGASDYDILPVSNATAIFRVYTINDGVENDVPDTEYTLNSPNQILWQETALNKPEAGATYYVDFEARPEVTQYEKTFVTSFDELDAYGGQLMKSASGGSYDTVNPVYTGAYIALESGAPGVYVIQVEPTDKTTYNVVMATDIQNALTRAEFIEDAYYIVPMTDDSTAVGAVISHCNAMSTTEERKERVCFVSSGVPDPTDTTGIFSTAELDDAIAEVSSIQNKRVVVPFATKATKVLSDGNIYDLGAEYVCAAMAGLKSLLPVQRALTRQRFYSFVELKHVTNLSRANKNKLAEAGFVILEQPGGPGSAIVIRHGITTKVDNIADRELSVVVVADFTAKYVRTSLEGYIGVYNINEFLKTKVKATINGCRNTLMRKGVINDLKLGTILQDESNPDTLLVDISLLPPFPCNYIDIKVLVE